MKTVTKLINDLGVVILPDPYKSAAVELVSVMYLPNIGDPDDPDDVDTLEFTYRLVDENA